MTDQPGPRIALIAGELSGDLLGAELMAALRERCPQARFLGVCGPRMRAQGCQGLDDIEALSVMGLVEVLRHLPRLLRLRRRLIGEILAWQPDLVIGIDAPDFNLGLELRLRRRGLRTLHYVSPSVWAWRRYRVKKIRRAVDRMLTLLPFERDFYLGHGVDARYVGHPLAERYPLQPDRAAARSALGLDGDAPVVALLPGSRRSEVRRLGPLFLDAAVHLLRQQPTLRFVLPCAKPSIEVELRDLLAGHPGLAACCQLTAGAADRAMTAADVVLLASGTATLEAMLCHRPMVMAYTLHPLTYQLARRLVRLPYYSLPNLIAGEALVEEFIQDQASPAALAAALAHWLTRPEAAAALSRRFAALHAELACDGARQAAAAALELLPPRGGSR